MTDHTQKQIEAMNAFGLEIAEMFGAGLANPDICNKCFSRSVLSSVVSMAVANGIISPESVMETAAKGAVVGLEMLENPHKQIEGVTSFDLPYGRKI